MEARGRVDGGQGGGVMEARKRVDGGSGEGRWRPGEG